MNVPYGHEPDSAGHWLRLVEEAVHEALFTADDGSDPDAPIPWLPTEDVTIRSDAELFGGVRPGQRVTIAVDWSNFNGQTLTVVAANDAYISARTDDDARTMRFDHGTYVRWQP